MRVTHQLIAILDVPRELGERVHHPELGERELDILSLPAYGEAVQVQRQRSALNDLLALHGVALELGPAKESADACQEVRQAHVLGDVVVGAHTQSRHRIEIAVARREKYYGERTGQRAQLPAKRESAVYLVAQPDIEQHEVRQAGAQGGKRFAPVAIGRDLVAMLSQRVGVVGAKDGIVFYDRDAAANARGLRQIFPATILTQNARRASLQQAVHAIRSRSCFLAGTAIGNRTIDSFYQCRRRFCTEQLVGGLAAYGLLPYFCQNCLPDCQKSAASSPDWRTPMLMNPPTPAAKRSKDAIPIYQARCGQRPAGDRGDANAGGTGFRGGPGSVTDRRPASPRPDGAGFVGNIRVLWAGDWGLRGQRPAMRGRETTLRHRSPVSGPQRLLGSLV